MSLRDVLRQYEQEIRKMEESFKGYFHSQVTLIPEVSDHLISSGGKRFRPLLLLIASDLCGYRGDRRYPLSAVVEFIHTATLLHDDVIDHAETRRGKPSANRVWGNSASVLVGDFLYSKSFQLMSADGDISVINLLSNTTNIMAEGEVLQLQKCGDIDITEKEYLSVIEKKTAVLISAACAVGALISRAPEAKIEAMARFGMRVGMAFQLTDDTLDYMAAEEEFGKAIGMDLKEGKITLPLIHTLRKCSPEDRKRIKKIVRDSAQDGHAIGEITALIARHRGVEYALEKARTYIEEAKTYLEPFEDSQARRALLTISDYIINRNL
jgi:octaprenyl-diphosphate synthase